MGLCYVLCVMYLEHVKGLENDIIGCSVTLLALYTQPYEELKYPKPSNADGICVSNVLIQVTIFNTVV